MRCKVHRIERPRRNADEDGNAQLRVPARDRSKKPRLISASRPSTAEYEGEVVRCRSGGSFLSERVRSVHTGEVEVVREAVIDTVPTL